MERESSNFTFLTNLSHIGYFKFRYAIEPLLMKYNVDLSIWAHEHDYERFWPVYNYQILNGTTEKPYTEPRGPVHIVTGSALKAGSTCLVIRFLICSTFNHSSLFPEL